MEEIPYHLWTDNIAAIQWIRKELHELKIFVANRVKEIQTYTEPTRWNHVRSEQNPADLISRGAPPKELVNNKLWWNGPDWLILPQEQWPVPLNIERYGCENDVLKEMKINIISKLQPLSIYVQNQGVVPLLDYSNTCAKVCRILAYVQRFINNCKNKARTSNMRTRSSPNKPMNANIESVSLPTTTEKRNAMKILIRLHQQHSYTVECVFLDQSDESIDYTKFPEKSTLHALRPFMDADGILRVGNRAQSASLPYDTKYPIIIENGSRLSHLIISEAHSATGHGNVQIMMKKKLLDPEIERTIAKFQIEVHYLRNMG